MAQFLPLKIKKHFCIQLEPWRFQVHRRSQVAAGEILWGSFILNNRTPVRVDAVTVELSCVQEATLTKPGEPQAAPVKTTGTILESARQVYQSPYGDDVLKPGFYAFPFEFLVPIDAPSSISYGNTAVAAMNGCSWKLKYVLVIAPIYLGRFRYLHLVRCLTG
jgi:hypothetical protein